MIHADFISVELEKASMAPPATERAWHFSWHPWHSTTAPRGNPMDPVESQFSACEDGMM